MMHEALHFKQQQSDHMAIEYLNEQEHLQSIEMQQVA